MKDKGLILKDGKYVPVASVTSFGKVRKLPGIGIEEVDLPHVAIKKFIEKGFKGITVENTTIIKIVPLTVNRAWRGRRFKTDRYKQYALAVSLMLPDNIIVPTGLFKVYYEFGMGVTSDFDNPVKLFTDILQAKYKFNDRNIMEANIRKVIVKKGEEYVKFRFEQL